MVNRAPHYYLPLGARACLRSLTTNATSQLNMLGHDGDTLGMNGAEIGIFKETHQVRFRRLLKGQDGRALETEIQLEILRNLSDQSRSTFGNDEVATSRVHTPSNVDWPVSDRDLGNMSY
jgi:hypothetical protein